MKKLSIGFILSACICTFTACNSGKSDSASTTDTSMTTTKDTSMAMGSSDAVKKDTTMAMNAGGGAVDEKTKDFVNTAATGGMLEVELGNIAAQKGVSAQVKDFGKMMVDDHTKANNTLKDLATKKGIDVPATVTDDQKKDIDKLSKKTGADFDKAYVDMMVDDHKKDIDDFKKASGNVGDNDVKNFATTTLPTLEKHLEAIKAIKSKM